MKRENAEEESFTSNRARSNSSGYDKKRSERTDSPYPDKRKTYAKDGAKTSYPKKRSEAGGYEKKSEFAKKEYGTKKRDQSDKPRVKKKREE